MASCFYLLFVCFFFCFCFIFFLHGRSQVWRRGGGGGKGVILNSSSIKWQVDSMSSVLMDAKPTLPWRCLGRCQDAIKTDYLAISNFIWFSGREEVRGGDQPWWNPTKKQPTTYLLMLLMTKSLWSIYFAYRLWSASEYNYLRFGFLSIFFCCNQHVMNTISRVESKRSTSDVAVNGWNQSLIQFDSRARVPILIGISIS